MTNALYTVCTRYFGSENIVERDTYEHLSDAIQAIDELNELYICCDIPMEAFYVIELFDDEM